MGELRPHHTDIGMAKQRNREKERQEVGGRAGRQARTVTNRGLILEDRGLPHLVISHTCSEMGNSHPWRKTRAQRNIGGYKKNRKKEKSRGFRLLGTNMKEEKGELLCWFFNEKKSVYLIIESFRLKRQSRKLAQTLQWKPSVTEKKSTHTHAHTHSRNPKKYRRWDSHPQQAYEAVLHCWQKSK